MQRSRKETENGTKTTLNRDYKFHNSIIKSKPNKRAVKKKYTKTQIKIKMCQGASTTTNLSLKRCLHKIPKGGVTQALIQSKAAY